MGQTNKKIFKKKVLNKQHLRTFSCSYDLPNFNRDNNKDFQYLDKSSIGRLSVMFSNAAQDSNCGIVQSGKVKSDICDLPGKYICKRGKTSCGFKAK